MPDYFDNVQTTIQQANSKALAVVLGSEDKTLAEVWDKVKGKNCKRYLPRGSAYRRLWQLERVARHAKTMQELAEAEKILKGAGVLND